MPTPVLPIHSLTKFYSKLKKVFMKLKYHFYLIDAPVQLLVRTHFFKLQFLPFFFDVAIYVTNYYIFYFLTEDNNIIIHLN